MDLVAVGLQEMEMGGSSLISAGAKELFARDKQEKGNEIAIWWCNEIASALEEGCVLAGDRTGRNWARVGTRQLSGTISCPSYTTYPYMVATSLFKNELWK